MEARFWRALDAVKIQVHGLMKIKRKTIFLAFFLAWVVLWVNFTVRDLTKKKYFKEYRTLLSRDAAGRASYAYDDRLYEFLKFCDSALPEGASYDLGGVEGLTIEWRRAIYYLYPRLNEKDADYILVFDNPGYARQGYAVFKELDKSRFILKRI